MIIFLYTSIMIPESAKKTLQLLVKPRLNPDDQATEEASLAVGDAFRVDHLGRSAESTSVRTDASVVVLRRSGRVTKARPQG